MRICILLSEVRENLEEVKTLIFLSNILLEETLQCLAQMREEGRSINGLVRLQHLYEQLFNDDD